MKLPLTYGYGSMRLLMAMPSDDIQIRFDRGGDRREKTGRKTEPIYGRCEAASLVRKCRQPAYRRGGVEVKLAAIR